MQIRRYTALLATTAMVGGAGIGVAQAQSDDRPAAPRDGTHHKRGPSAAQISALAEKLGVSTDRLEAALAAVRPERPAAGRRPKRGDLAADLAKALGVEEAKVQEILDANRPARPTQRPARGTRPPRPDHSRLIAALASGLGIEQATVKAAFDKLEAARKAEHDARHAAFAAALARSSQPSWRRTAGG
jgi:protein-disulfide isomerase-like protein with CxxC motif